MCSLVVLVLLFNNASRIRIDVRRAGCSQPVGDICLILAAVKASVTMGGRVQWSSWEKFREQIRVCRPRKVGTDIPL